MKNVHAGEVACEQTPSETPALPERVQVALGELVGVAREGLVVLSVGVGLGVLHELMAEEVDECGKRPRPSA